MKECGHCLTYDDLLVYLEKFLMQKLLCGEIQGGLLACNSGTECEPILPQGTQIVTCQQLKDLVQELINSGDLAIPGLVDVTIDKEKWILTIEDQANKEWRVDLSELGAKGVKELGLNNGELTMTLMDGTTVKLQLPLVKDFALDRDDQLTLTLTDGQKFTVDLSPAFDAGVRDFVMDVNGDLVLTTKDGKQHKVEMTALLKKLSAAATVKSIRLDDKNNLILTLGDGSQLEADLNGLVPVFVDRDSALTGNGTEENPLGFDPTRICWQFIEEMHFTEEGLVIQLANACDPVVLPLSEFLTVLANKVKVCVAEQGIITGDGTEGKCLAIDLKKLAELLTEDSDAWQTIINKINSSITIAHDETLKGAGTPTDRLGVQLSADAGNMLEARDNGLYYGVQAPADVANLYIDSTGGNDANAGTRAAPLRTIAEAARRTPAQQSSSWHLRCGRTYPMDLDIPVTSGAVRVISAYDDPWIDGDKVPEKSPQYPAYIGHMVDQVNRPVVKALIHYDDVGQYCNMLNFNITGGAQVQPWGILFDFTPDNDLPSVGKQSYRRYNEAMFYGSSGGSVSFYGCKFKTPAVPAGIESRNVWWKLSASSSFGDVVGLQFNSCHWVDGGGSALCTLGGASNNVFATTWPTDDDNPLPSPGVKIQENIISRLAQPNAMLGIVWGPEGAPRNASANFVIKKE